MILRMWRAFSTVAKADDYVSHASQKVFPRSTRSKDIAEHICFAALQCESVELVVLRLWESMQAVPWHRSWYGNGTALVPPIGTPLVLFGYWGIGPPPR